MSWPATARAADPGGGARDSTAAPAPSANRHALISTPGSSSRYIAALLTSTQMESTCSHCPDSSSALASCQLGIAPAQPWPARSKASVLPRSAQALDDVTAEARAKIAGAGGNNHGADVRRRQAGALQRLFRGFRGQARCVRGEASMEGIRIDREDLFQRVDGQRSFLDAVVALQDRSGDEMRPGIQPPEPLRLREGLPALRLRVSMWRKSGTQWH